MQDRLRILLTNKARSWTGETAYVRMLALGLSAADCEVLVAARPESVLAARLAADGLAVAPLRLESRRNTLGNLWHDARALRRLAATFSPQILHTNASWDTWEAAMAFLAFRHPALRIRTKHNLKRVRRSPMNRLLYRRAIQHVIAPSAPVLAHLQATGLLEPERLHLVWYGIPLERYRVAPAARRECRSSLLALFPGQRDPLIAAYVSRLTERKHPELAIEAVRALPSGPGRRPVVLVLAGNDATEVGRRCRDLAAGEPRIAFLGFREDVVPILAGADLFLLPAPAEAFGMAVIEAMAAGVPPLLPASGAFPHLVRHDQSGLLYPADDPLGGLIAALERARTETGLLERLASAAPGAATLFSQERMVAETLELYRGLLSAGA